MMCLVVWFVLLGSPLLCADKFTPIGAFDRTCGAQGSRMSTIAVAVADSQEMHIGAKSY
jgi:hypothetical protein